MATPAPSRRLLRPSLLTALALAPFIACGESEKDTDDADLEVGFPDAPDTPSEVSESVGLVELCDGYARACCKLQVCFNPNDTALADGCVEAIRERCDDGVFGPVNTHVQPGDLTYSPDSAGACLTPYLTATCDNLSTVTGSPSLACDDVFVGTKTQGEACDFDQLCSGDLFCKPGANGTCPGTCEPRAALGEPCNVHRQLCEKGLQCTGFGDREGTCVAPKVEEDGACFFLTQCPSGQFCDTGAGRCKDVIAEGQPCNSFGCERPLYCTGNPGTCERLPELGEPCEFTCADGAVCSVSGTCVVEPTELGAPCADAFFPCGTQTGLQCRRSDNTCIGPLPLGAPCGGETGTSDCDFGWCDRFGSGKCEPWKAFGEACTRDEGSCGPFECFDDKCSLPGGPCRGPRLDEW
jgi:hypothetical protein